MLGIKCCYGCKDRKTDGTNCHATCERYLAERDEIEKTRKEIYAARKKDSVYYSYKRDLGMKLDRRNK